MSLKLSPILPNNNLYQNNFINKPLPINIENTKNISNDNLIPTYDLNTDLRFLMNLEANLYYQSNSNPYNLSKLSIDKYNQMKKYNPEYIQVNENLEEEKDNNIYGVNTVVNKNNFNESDKEENIENEKIEIKKYKKINEKINKNNLRINHKKEKNRNEIEIVNNNLKISSILSDTIGENFDSTFKKENTKKNDNDGLIDYLKKENFELKKKNEKLNQLINSLFYFINQLSQNYTKDKKNFELSPYNINLNALFSDLNLLNESIQNHLNEKKLNDTTINSSKTIEKKKSKNIKKINKIERLKNEVILGKTFTFGQNDSLNEDNLESKKYKNQNSQNKLIKEKNQIKIMNNNSKKRNNINLLGCNVKGNGNKIKDKSKNNLKKDNFNFIPNEKDAMRSVKNIIYE